MNRRAVVTGGAGFIGSTLVDLLVDRSWDVLVVDNLRTGSMENLAGARRRGKVSVHVMDVRAPELAEACARFGPEVVFHLAAQTKVPASVADPVADADVNVLGTINVLEAARAAAARKVVFASSGGAVYGHRSPNRAKWTEEYQCDVLDETLRVYLSHPDVVGVAIWQFCDVRITRGWWRARPRTMNNKGTVDEFRRPKLAYDVVKRRMHAARRR